MGWQSIAGVQLAAVAVGVAGCVAGRLVEEGGETASTSTGASTSADESTTQGVSASAAITDGGDGSDAESSDPSSDCPFICLPDGGSPNVECDIWAQDCPADQKCMPWAHDGGNSWNAVKCTPLDDTPAGVGEPCTVVGSGVSGIDDCELAAMCWNVDENNMGECVAFCEGSEANPTCADPGTACTISSSDWLILCLPWCDPLLQDCREGQGCYPVNEIFWCASDLGRDAGGFGQPCEYVNSCAAGLFCAAADGVPGCRGEHGCCSDFCDLSVGDAMCTGAAQGQVCVPWFDRDQAPSGQDNVGACVLPE